MILDSIISALSVADQKFKRKRKAKKTFIVFALPTNSAGTEWLVMGLG